MSNPLTIVAICISLTALFFAVKNYHRKFGVFIRGSFSIASSIECDDSYVSNIILENLKDRAITIFCVYLKIGHNYYLEIENFEENPLLLKAYEAYQKRYGPIQFYGINVDRINLNVLLKDIKISKQIVLSTSDGKYKVPSSIKHWNPVSDFFRNHMTAIVHPVRSTYKEMPVGGNIKYIIEFVAESGANEIVLIHPLDYKSKKFNSFSLTYESLINLDSLTTYIQSQFDNGNLLCKNFTVYTTDNWHKQRTEFYNGEFIEAKFYGFFHYKILGRIMTKISDIKLKIENTKLNKK